MTRQEKRIAIARECGWLPSTIDGCWNNAKRMETREKLPDYFNDLNAMHGALLVLTDMQWHDYEQHLRDFCDGMSHCEGAGRELLRSTASQQAEAFGKTLNLW